MIRRPFDHDGLGNLSEICYNRIMKSREAITTFGFALMRQFDRPLRLRQRWALLALVLGMVACSPAQTCFAQNEIVLRLPMSTAGPNSLDPVRGSTLYENTASVYVYETLLEYEYLTRPFKLKPLLLEKMPEVSSDGKTFTFQLRDDIYFHDDPCFENGKGRKLVTDDVFYSLKRMADLGNQPKSWWLMQDTIEGFDQYRQRQNAAESFDYAAPVSGMKKIDDRNFQIVLNKPFYRFIYTLAMFQTSVLPKEAVDFYGDRLSRHPVGTGPFLLEHWETGVQMVYRRNPNYRDVRYPADPGLNADGSPPYPDYPQDKALGLYEDAGQRLPLADRVVLTMFPKAQPSWLKFLNQELDFTGVPAENFEQAFIKRKRTLRQSFVKQGIRTVALPQLDMIYNGFNMEDPDFGGYTDQKKWVRQAISLAVDLDELNDAFYEGINLIYDGPIPNGLDGHPEGHTAEVNYRGPNLQKARELLKRAGHPNGEGLPKLVYFTSQNPQSVEMAYMTARNLKKIGITMEVNAVDFSELSEKLREKGAPFFGLAWGSDYPDAENNLQLYYGPFKSPMSNNFNYDRPQYNQLYDEIRVMQPSPQRTAKYIKMRNMIIEDVPMIGSMARTQYYLIHDRLKNFKPERTFSNWVKYLTIKEE
jgi:ABC-type transport system substrate-binding protein